LSKKKNVIAKRLKKEFVLDCSIVMAWYFADESDAYADLVARQLPDLTAFVPMNWPLEVANTLIIGERLNRSTPAQAARLIASLAALPISVDDETNVQAWSTTLNLARQQSLTAYDAAYLELAIRRGLPIATLEDRLRAAAKIAGVSLFRAR
jgi:predicted nucleic acid-binding protein